MKILVIGSGGREHALVWKLAQSPLVEALYAAPGNPGMAQHAECVAIPVTETGALVDFARDHGIGLVVVGPEDPLADGIVDRFGKAGLVAFGPSGAAAQLEASKIFAKRFMQRHGIPTAAHAEFDNAEEAIAYAQRQGTPLVVKADGLAAGKGVTVARDMDSAVKAIREAMVEGAFGAAGSRIVIEECLLGEEASILAFCDGKTAVPMMASQDHKPLLDGDAGPNTGGMGAYSPAPVVTADRMEEIVSRILEPCVAGMAAEGMPYKGVLYAGLMITTAGPRVIEFNCRFGDPETQVVLPQLQSDLVPVMQACCEGSLENMEISWNSGACVTVVMASGGYPKSYPKGKMITGIEEAEREPGVKVFHAGTKQTPDGLVTNGGRVLNVTAFGSDIASTIEKAYGAVRRIHFDGAHFRTDIGAKALART
ncbi:MAG TPA: phosphoribosylamine--glycine ligase [Candidatus Hydrogenedentes bacterium]|nr:phosphoribosylamine--glycine ligase [Candidatus Hydrogenedentota bacterium]HPC15365.1 phosphoribosylamine--glycine ligase [Candidatus Hydrogenedentota bacterium]HRT19320.1 phosphoribosylamine--glycine ligase [Candidatus Hydrogenedentota bacterium]HRT63400.1 phosphoribosylamine--glycine ligase [Candidatus Hydrogenedentota bacterium]